MFKLSNLYKRLTEGKQVGDVYHYTGWYNFLKMLLIDNKIKLSDVNNKSIPAVSTTRDTNFENRSISNGVVTSIALKLDGDKLSEKYQVRPYNDSRTEKTKYYGDEMEEMWYGKQLEKDGGIYPLWRYLKEVLITKDGLYSLKPMKFDYGINSDDKRIAAILMPNIDNPTMHWDTLRSIEKFDIIAKLLRSKGIQIKVK